MNIGKPQETRNEAIEGWDGKNGKKREMKRRSHYSNYTSKGKDTQVKDIICLKK